MSRILVVEDEKDLAVGLADDLRVEGYDVDVAFDGETAARKARESSWNLMTAKSEEAERVLGLEIGADDYITKPFSARELRARVKAVLRRTETESTKMYRFGDVEADFPRGVLKRAGRPVEVTALELKLLEAFVGARGRILSRQQLLEAAWSEDVFVTDRAVDFHIVRLRRKIEPDPKIPRYLVSVRGLGYRFDG
jgi:two-component system alkaline phosphatase synthesis response regulator PhoP